MKRRKEKKNFKGRFLSNKLEKKKNKIKKKNTKEKKETCEFWV